MRKRTLMILPVKAGARPVRGRYPVALESDGDAVEATSPQSAVIGVADGRAAVPAGATVDTLVAGVGEFVCGAPVEAGDLLVAGDTGGGRANRVIPRRDEGGGIFQAIVGGAAANTDIAVAGLTAKSDVIGVVNLTDNAMAPGITSKSGAIRSTGATNNKRLLVTWRDEQRIVGIALEAGATGDIIGALIAPHGY